MAWSGVAVSEDGGCGSDRCGFRNCMSNIGLGHVFEVSPSMNSPTIAMNSFKHALPLSASAQSWASSLRYPSDRWNKSVPLNCRVANSEARREVREIKRKAALSRGEDEGERVKLRRRVGKAAADGGGVATRDARDESPSAELQRRELSRLMPELQSLMSDMRMHIGTSSPAPSAKKAGKPEPGMTSSFSP